MPEPRLIFVNRVYWPSQEATAQLLTDLAEALAARGWEVHVVASGDDENARAGVHVHRTGPADTAGGLVQRARSYRRFRREAGERVAALARPGDVVIALTDPPLLGVGLASVCRQAGAHLVHWMQDVYPEIAQVHFGLAARLLLRAAQSRRDRAWQQAAACVVLGEDMAALVRAHGVAPDRLHLLPNWAPHELGPMADPGAIRACRERWGVADKFAVVYSGNLGRVHEFATLLAAASALRDTPEIVFLFVGRGPRFAAVQADARRLGLENVRFLPPEPRASLGAALAAADAHLVTLRPEYGQLVYPSKLAGALAAGRPVLFVGPRDGEIARLLHARECGAAVGPGDGAGAAQLLRQWHADPAARDRLANHARSVALELFALDSLAVRWDVLLRSLAPTP